MTTPPYTNYPPLIKSFAIFSKHADKRLGRPFTFVVIGIYFWQHINNRPGECSYLFGFRPLTIVVCQLVKEGLPCTVPGGSN
jgi:hypothetical protein